MSDKNPIDYKQCLQFVWRLRSQVGLSFSCCIQLLFEFDLDEKSEYVLAYFLKTFRE